MTKEENEPVERLQEIIAHPADRTFNKLHDQGLAAKKELADERRELTRLLNLISTPSLKQGSKEYKETQDQIQALKEKISKTHNELMEILRTEEKISREIQERNS